MRFVTALAGVLLLLACHFPLIAFTAQANGMVCCQDGHSCCRRLHHNSAAPQWQSANCGAAGCCVPPGTSPVPFHAISTPAALHVGAAVACVPALRHQQYISRPLPLDLFERPPPAFA